jgi:hypothetical protein
MSGVRLRGTTPILDLGPVAAAVKRAVWTAPKSKSRKPTKAMLAFHEGNRATKKERTQFGKIAETIFYQGRYTIRQIDGKFEIWDAETSDVYGPYPTHADARAAVGRL